MQERIVGADEVFKDARKPNECGVWCDVLVEQTSPFLLDARVVPGKREEVYESATSKPRSRYVFGPSNARLSQANSWSPCVSNLLAL